MLLERNGQIEALQLSPQTGRKHRLLPGPDHRSRRDATRELSLMAARRTQDWRPRPPPESAGRRERRISAVTAASSSAAWPANSSSNPKSVCITGMVRSSAVSTSAGKETGRITERSAAPSVILRKPRIRQCVASCHRVGYIHLEQRSGFALRQVPAMAWARENKLTVSGIQIGIEQAAFKMGCGFERGRHENRVDITVGNRPPPNPSLLSRRSSRQIPVSVRSNSARADHPQILPQHAART